MIPELVTERLLLRAFRADDVEPYLALCADAEVMRYLSGEPLSPEDAWRQLAMFIGHWTLRGFGSWAVEERASGLFVGRIGLHCPEGWPERELGFAMARRFWGRGLASEGCAAALEHARRALRFETVVSLIHPDNRRSRALALRLGGRHDGTTQVRGHELDVFTYRDSAGAQKGGPS